MGNAGGRPRTVEEFLDKYREVQISPITHGDLPAGVCHGMCLDWARRMMHKQVALFKALTTSRDPRIVKRVLTVEAETHDLFVQAANNFRLRNKESIKLILDSMKKAKERRDTVRETTRAFTFVESSGFLAGADLANLTDFIDETAHHALAEVNRLDRFIRDKAARVQVLALQMNDDELRYGHWFSTFRTLYRNKYQGEVNFDRVVYSKARNTQNPSTAIDWIAGILANIRLLTAGQCALLNFRRADGGHFVAFHFDGGTYHFFDPNVGWYGVNSAEKLAEAFDDLWHAGYRALNYNQSDWRVFMNP